VFEDLAAPRSLNGVDNAVGYVIAAQQHAREVTARNIVRNVGKIAPVANQRENLHRLHAFGDAMTNSTSDGTPPISSLWQNGMEIFNGKFQVVPENYAKTKWVPAISTGFIARTNVRNVGNSLNEDPHGMTGKTDGDVYVVASNVLPIKPIPIVLNFGVRGTNAELWGMGGNAPDWQARSFDAVAFVFKGPAKSTIIFGSEFAQQPHNP
jgi:hypothetical protein